MVKVYTIASGKGGTGKTTVSVNLGTMLAKLGKETYLMDADIGMANVGLILGLQDAPVTLHEILPEKTILTKAFTMVLPDSRLSRAVSRYRVSSRRTRTRFATLCRRL